ncbi:MAG: ArdC-like ssDNA-binding domain-containing protein [Pirellulales bacterium]
MLNGFELSSPATQLLERDEAKDQVARAVESLAEELAAGRSQTLLAYLRFLARFHEYSFRNVILVAMQRPDASLVAGRRSWEKLGRKVKERETPIGILAPITKSVLVLDAESGEDFEEDKLLGFRTVPVFDLQQTEGKPLPALNRTLGDATSLIPAMERVIAEADIELNYELLRLGTNGWTDGRTITVRNDLTSGDKFRCLVHELAHCLLGHLRRRGDFAAHVRETEAEAVAFVVCQAFGIDSRERSSDYIQLWDGSVETLMGSLKAVQQTAGHIIARVKELK